MSTIKDARCIDLVMWEYNLFISASLVEHKRLEAKVQVRIFAIDFVLKYILIPNNCKDE